MLLLNFHCSVDCVIVGASNELVRLNSSFSAVKNFIIFMVMEAYFA
jgi:hypothetical protein